MAIMIHGKRWDELSADERKTALVSIVRQVVVGVVRVALLWAALADIQKRPPEQIRGSKHLWRFLSFVIPIAPLAYFLVGRKRLPAEGELPEVE